MNSAIIEWLRLISLWKFPENIWLRWERTRCTRGSNHYVWNFKLLLGWHAIPFLRKSYAQKNVYIIAKNVAPSPVTCRFSLSSPAASPFACVLSCLLVMSSTSNFPIDSNHRSVAGQTISLDNFWKNFSYNYSVLTYDFSERNTQSTFYPNPWVCSQSPEMRCI